MKRFYNNEKNIIVFIDFVICADTCMGGYSTRGPIKFAFVDDKTGVGNNDYLVQAGIANSSYVHYPECNDVAVFFTEKERNQIEVLETEYVNKLLKQYNNCICR